MQTNIMKGPEYLRHLNQLRKVQRGGGTTGGGCAAEARGRGEGMNLIKYKKTIKYAGPQQEVQVGRGRGVCIGRVGGNFGRGGSRQGIYDLGFSFFRKFKMISVALALCPPQF